MGRTNANTVKNKRTCQIRDKFKKVCSKHSRISRFLITYGLSLGFAVVLSVIGVFFNKNKALVSLFINTINYDSYLNTFYTYYNTHDEIPYQPENIIIVDVKNSFSSRNNIADVLESLAAQKPRLILVDFFFENNDSYDIFQNEALQKSIANIKDSVELVFVGHLNKKGVFEKSFFAKSLDLQFGASNFCGFREYVKYYQGKPRIAIKMAALLGADTGNIPRHFITNYRTKKIKQLPVSDSLGLDTLSSINHNDVVLIGQTSSPYDIKRPPFAVNKEKDYLSGIETIAYELSSILAYDEKAKSNYEYPYTPSVMWSIIIYLFFSFLYSIAYVRSDILMDKIKRKKIISLPYKIISSFSPIVSPVLLLFVEFLVVVSCFFVTAHFFSIPNISLLIASFVFVEPSYNCSQKIIKLISNDNEKD